MNRTVREWVGLVSVVSSLLFVGLEIRSNTAAVKGATLQGISDQSLAVTLAGAQTPEIRGAITKVLAGRDAELSPEEEDAVVLLYTAALRVSEHRFRQIELGSLEAPSSVGGGSVMYRIRFFREFWAARRFEYPTDFQAYVDDVLIPIAIEDSIPRLLQR